MLERGGNAFDAAVVMGLVLQVVEPHLCGPAGDLPAIFRPAGRRGQRPLRPGRRPGRRHHRPLPRPRPDPRPRLRPPRHRRPRRLRRLDAAPARPRHHRPARRDRPRHRLRPRRPPAPARRRPHHRRPRGLLPRRMADLRRHLDAGRQPRPPRTPSSATRRWRRPTSASPRQPRRRPQGRASTPPAHAWREGFVAEAIAAYLADAEVMDVSGRRHRGVLTRADMAAWRATYEAPATLDYHGWTLHKTGPWGQGPVLLQALSLLRGFDLGAMDPNGPDFVHTVGRGDQARLRRPRGLLRRPRLRRDARSPLSSPRTTPPPPRADRRREPRWSSAPAASPASSGRPTPPSPAPRATSQPRPAPTPASRRWRTWPAPGDTVHLDVIDRWGNIVSATPSGGWLQSSPVIPGLGFPLELPRPDVLARRGPADLAPPRRRARAPR